MAELALFFVLAGLLVLLVRARPVWLKARLPFWTAAPLALPAGRAGSPAGWKRAPGHPVVLRQLTIDGAGVRAVAIVPWAMPQTEWNTWFWPCELVG